MKTVDVVIPVHNSAHWLAWCLEELFRFKSVALNDVFVVNDHSEEDQTHKINEIVARYPTIKFLETEHGEGGFGYACNLGASKCSADLVLFLNTDCLLTDGVIDRLSSVFENDSEVALACPFSNNSSNITYPMLPGFSYRDMAKLLAEITNESDDQYIVEACTIVGNCLMIRRDFFQTVGGFSSDWGIGYGEETDLHMKALAQGLKGVVHTGCYVYHYGGGTFNYEQEIESHREKNYQLFMSKWAEEYNKLALRCETINPVHIVNTNLEKYLKDKKDRTVELDALFYLLRWAKGFVDVADRSKITNPLYAINRKLEQFWGNKNKVIELDILFYLPGIDQGVGGVNAVIAICNDLIRRGLKAGVALIGASDFQIEQYSETVLFNFLHFETNEDFLADTTVLPKIVFSTIVWSGPIVSKFAAERNAVAAQFVQGYEAYFWNGTRYLEATKSYRSTDYLVTTSNWLYGMVKRHLTDGQDIQQLPLVVNKEIFFSGNSPRPIEIILILRSSTDKGQWVLVELLDRLLAANKSVTVFCATDYSFLRTKYGEQAQFINLPVDQYSLAKIMRRAKLFVDASLHEGYGLLPLEAALCGCSLLLSDSGGVRDFIKNYDGEIIPNLLNLDDIIAAIDRILENFDEKKSVKSTPEESYSGKKWYEYFENITKDRSLPFFQPESINIPEDNQSEFIETVEEEMTEFTHIDVEEIAPEESMQTEEIPQPEPVIIEEVLPSTLQQDDPIILSPLEAKIEAMFEKEKNADNPKVEVGTFTKIYRFVLPQRLRLALKILRSGKM